ncbi:LPP20 family lipoprotein [Catenovulum sp. SM1970]|uniref:LPP20 family lipoprotein n=1 Tax=Marinifaba aquimaris TaxID=2741323 RepID=UPI001571D13D|nr:LPP20 family lipoprotein [Marinifaba aquimaris]NTS75411.1 LPP20 family lipoprotein [Marinifaba aquimaris]
MKIIFTMLLVMGLTACATEPVTMEKHYEWEYLIPDEDYVVAATGYAAIDIQKGHNASSKMIKAIKASKLDAYRDLTEKVHGQKLYSQMKVSDLMLGNEQLKASVQGVIKGARVIKTYQLDGIYVTELELNLRDLYRIRAFTNGQAKAVRARYL